MPRLWGTGRSPAPAGGSFFQSATFNMLADVGAQVGASAAMGDPVTFGTFAGSLAGGFVGSKLPGWKGINGNGFKNAIGEIAHNTIKGSIRGFASGATASLIDGNNVWEGGVRGAKNGAIGGAAYSTALIATFGATYQLNEYDKEYIDAIQEKYKFEGEYTVRKGGLYQLMGAPEVTWGNTIVANKYTSPETFGHEYGHVYQFHTQGWGNFQGRGIYEQTIGPRLLNIVDPYLTRGYNEFKAENRLHSVNGCSSPFGCF